MTLPLAWEVLRRAVNSEPPLVGTVGVRDPESVCEAFDGEGYDGRGRCMSDGHYLCTECSELSPDAYRFTEYGRAGRRDRLLLFWRRRRIALATAPG
jgi:hypothetical protein